MALLDRLLALVGLDFALDLTDAPFHRITPHLHLGAKPRPEELEGLREAGITHVVSCLPERQRARMAFLDEGFDATFLPLRDSMHEDVGACFPAFFDAVDRARAGGGEVLVHCEVGVSRSATLATALVMRERPQRFFDAYGHVRSRRAQVLPNIGFATQLQRLEQQLGLGPPEGHSSLTRYLREVCRVPLEADVLETMLADHGFDAVATLEAVFAGEIPRVVQGVRV